MGFGMHPARRMSMVHHRDIATAVTLALSGAMEGRIINIADDAPMSVCGSLRCPGGRCRHRPPRSTTPGHLQMDASRARGLGFRPAVRTVLQVAQEDVM